VICYEDASAWLRERCIEREEKTAESLPTVRKKIMQELLKVRPMP